MNDHLFRKFVPVLIDPTPPVLRDQRLLIEKADKLNIYYAPFEYVNSDARIVLVGITPGPTQMANANNEARSALQRGMSAEVAMRSAKLTASFSGEPMRGNLIRQLDDWGVPQWLGINNAASLFAEHAGLIHCTSLLRFPTFVSDKAYAGSPDMVRNPFLKKFLYEYFVEEVQQLPNAIFIGLGPKVHRVLKRLVRERVIGSDQVALGMLHPSGNNTYRISYLTSERRGPAPHATDPTSYDAGRTEFREKFAAYSSHGRCGLKK